MLVELGTQIDQLVVIRKQFLIERRTGLCVGIGLALKIPTLSQIETPLQYQPQTDQPQQRPPVLPVTIGLARGEYALSQIIHDGLLRQPAMGIVDRYELAHRLRRDLLFRAVGDMRRRASAGQARPLLLPQG